jgi:hypothetical protein
MLLGITSQMYVRKLSEQQNSIKCSLKQSWYKTPDVAVSLRRLFWIPESVTLHSCYHKTSNLIYFFNMHAICLLLVELLPHCIAHVSGWISGIHGIGVVCCHCTELGCECKSLIYTGMEFLNLCESAQNVSVCSGSLLKNNDVLVE